MLELRSGMVESRRQDESNLDICSIDDDPAVGHLQLFGGENDLVPRLAWKAYFKIAGNITVAGADLYSVQVPDFKSCIRDRHTLSVDD